MSSDIEAAFKLSTSVSTLLGYIDGSENLAELENENLNSWVEKLNSLSDEVKSGLNEFIESVIIPMGGLAPEVTTFTASRTKTTLTSPTY